MLDYDLACPSCWPEEDFTWSRQATPQQIHGGTTALTSRGYENLRIQGTRKINVVFHYRNCGQSWFLSYHGSDSRSLTFERSSAYVLTCKLPRVLLLSPGMTGIPLAVPSSHADSREDKERGEGRAGMSEDGWGRSSKRLNAMMLSKLLDRPKDAYKRGGEREDTLIALPCNSLES